MAEARGRKQRGSVSQPAPAPKRDRNAPEIADHTPQSKAMPAAQTNIVAGSPAGGDPTEIQLVTFSVGAEEFGVPIAFVKEIVRVPSVTRVPKTPAFIEGVANLRGTLLPIINLRCRFDMPAEERSDDTRAVVVEADGRLAGLVVDRVSEVIRIPLSHIEPPLAVGDGNAHPWLQGVAKLHDGQRLVLLLEVDKVVPSSEIAQTSTRAAKPTSAARQTQAASAEMFAGEQVVTFRLDREEFALPIKDVREIIRVPEVSRIPHAPDYVEGIVSLRDRLVPIVSLRTWFGLGSSAANDDNRMVIVNVDAVSEVLTLPPHTVQEPPRIVGGGDADHLRGVAKLDEGRRLIMLLDAGRILPAAELTALSDAVEEEASMSTVGDRLLGRVGEDQLFVGFHIGDEEFGVPIQYVQEIIWLPEITRVPRTPPFIEGIINLRGNVLPVIDLRKRFGMPARHATESTSIVVVDIDGHRSGVIVDEVSEVRRLAADAIEPPPAVAGSIDTSFVKGIGKLDGGSRMLMILDLDGIVAVNEAGATA
jgi:purine-binding chemotaxis protein CheW